MDPILEESEEWLEKNVGAEDPRHVGNVARSWEWREMGINPGQNPPNKTVMENMAEDILVQKELKIRSCDLPGYPRSTFLMVFSPDGTKVASTHGNHNVYVSELASGRHVRILQGHPRTPWCIAFHPARAQLIGSGCLGGQVRVWDLSGGSEVWTVRAETVVASIAFHPRDQLLVIATSNELYFWDWSQPAPAVRVSTNNINEKVRYVAFDSLGFKLITGISVWGASGAAAGSLLTAHQPHPAPPPQPPRPQDPGADEPGQDRPAAENAGSTQEMIVNSYQNLVQRYDSLVRNYQRLFMARTQLTATNTTTTDRGTDPMETDMELPSTSRAAQAHDSSTSRRTEGAGGGDEPGGSRLLNFDVLSIRGGPSRSAESDQNNSSTSSPERSIFGSRSSAFQRLNDSLERSTGPASSLGADRTSPRLLPNPFSSTSTQASGTQGPEAGSSRTRLFTSRRADSPAERHFLQRRRHVPGAACPCVFCARRDAGAWRVRPRPPRPATADTATQLDGAATVHASLDLIRDILRDSGTRLLNLITSMSLSTLASVERGAARERPHRRRRPRVRLFTASLRRELFSTEDEDEDISRARPSRAAAEAEATVESDRLGTGSVGTGSEPGASGSAAGTLPPAAAFRAVRLAVAALQRHTAHLADVWLGGGRASTRDLRRLWENLRRRVRALQRQAPAAAGDVAPQYYTRGLLERCRLLGETSAAGGARRPSPASPAPRRRPAAAGPTPARRRAAELHCTRNEIRQRAMQVLSVMFDMMMSCLEEGGLSELIVQMLRTLKKALALTCLMLMTNCLAAGPAGERARRAPAGEASAQARGGRDQARAARDDDAMSTSSWPTSDSDADRRPTEGGPVAAASPARPAEVAPPPRYSERLAVQIAAANRNTSCPARTRRDLYRALERQRALHRTDPAHHPVARRKGGPPAQRHRIPAVRRLPPKRAPPAAAAEPVAGPSREPRLSEGTRDTIVDFEQRVNLYRIAHMHAVRLRTAARTRLRRLQTIRLYTPSSVREMFAIQSNSSENRPASPTGGAEAGARRPFSSMQYRPHILAREVGAGRGGESARQFDAILNNVSMPFMHVSELLTSAAPGGRARGDVHGYLQPIILAQNALLIDGESGGGLGGLLDSGHLSDTLPAPTHRVQAWDFTQGGTPDIADSAKNVVVQRCRIHNDASIDISKDGRLLVALLPAPRLRNARNWLGIYSLEWGSLGCCLQTAALEQSAVSVALSPTARHLAVGLGSRRVTTLPHARNNVFALLYRLQPLENSLRPVLAPIKELEQNWEQGFTSLNCLRWAPQPGQGLVYANNTGQLIVMS